MAIYLRNLRLQNFRFHTNTAINITENVHVIVGRNDSGKTSVLDALKLFFDQVNISPDNIRRDSKGNVADIDSVRISARLKIKNETNVSVGYADDYTPVPEISSQSIEAAIRLIIPWQKTRHTAILVSLLNLLRFSGL